MATAERKTKDLVLIGGGHSHVEVLRSIARNPVAGLRTTVVSRELRVPYSGMLPGYIAGHYSWDDIHIDLAPLAAAAGARLIAGTVGRIDTAKHLIFCGDRPALYYDVASINCGAAPALSEIRDADRFGVPVKPISQFIPRWHQLLERLKQSDLPRFKLAIVGGGAGGIELALAIGYRLARVERLDNIDILLLSADPRLIVGHNDAVRAGLAKKLSNWGIDVHLSVRVLGARAGALETDTDGTLAVDEVLWVTRAAPQSWPEAAGLTVDGAGFILVNESLQSVSDPAVFAAGDIASVDGHPRPKAGVFAVRQGPVLAENLRRAVCGRALRRYQPQQKFLSLISTGERNALASRGDYAAQGRWAWYWKDWIDRRFVRRFRVRGIKYRTPRWHVSPAPDKRHVNGFELLSVALERAGIEADAVVQRPVVNSLEVQSIGALHAPIDDPYYFGQIAAEDTLNGIYAYGGSPRSALGWLTVPDAGKDQMNGDIVEFVAGAMRAFERAGVELLGGRFIEGGDYRAGFAITGTVHEGDLWDQHRCVVDDVLVLTKPLGTGILLAAQTQGRCRGDWLQSALESMTISNRASLPVLRAAGVHAAVHVGEGGLLGQAGRMAISARLCVEVLPARVPLFNGLEACWSTGDQLDIERALAHTDFSEFSEIDARIASLVDTQISGGILAAVKPDHVVACVSKLRAMGYPHASIIGRVIPPRNDGLACYLAKEPQPKTAKSPV